eukprot:TRINITY_DN8016_c0_g1_i1.p1 TRINITY_DN8016_c0_g1~~TRINITY_DN8016_c0_g1_i1.p1  ORF type:complete len:1006 (+),score=396.06 TRINITY_DN8016_c0_g1_i1:220-3018(+)
MAGVYAECTALAADPPPYPHCVLSLTIRKLGLTVKETLAFVWAVLYNVGESFTYGDFISSDVDPTETAVIRRASGLTPSEFLAFIASERPHIKDGIIDLSEGYNAMINNQAYLVSRVLITALLESPLTSEEYLKVAGTAISDVMEEWGLTSNVIRVNPDGAGAGGDAEEAVADESPEDSELPAEAAPLEAQVNAEAEGGGGAVDAAAPKPRSDVAVSPVPPESLIDTVLLPYNDDLEYLQDRFEVVAARLKLHTLGMQDDQQRRWDSQTRPESQKREYQSAEKAALKKCKLRLDLTERKCGGDVTTFIRLERLRTTCELNEFEMWVLITLIGAQVSVEIRKIDTGKYSLEVGQLLGMHCPKDLGAQMKLRASFQKRAPLVKNNLIRVSTANGDSITQGNLNDFLVDMDRRMLDFCVGLDTEIGDLVDAAAIVNPEVDIDQVILHPSLKRTVLNAVGSHARAKEFREMIGFNAAVGNYGTGTILLFHGPPGTGKTMFANALAKHLGKRILVINVPLFNSRGVQSRLREAFREASIQNALIFFDECDMVLGDNTEWTATLLTELERFDGLMVMATNSVNSIGDALHRRITMTLEFPHPDPSLRRDIWRSHIPEKLQTVDVDWQQLSEYELSGGFIKNAVMCAITTALSRASPEEEPVVTGKDLNEACRQQVQGRLRVKADSIHRVSPKHSLGDMVVDPPLKEGLNRIIDFERARGFLQHQWGFSGGHANGQGTTVLFTGPSGTGKTLAAEALAYELSRTLLVFNASEAMGKLDASGLGTAMFFKQARDNNAVLLLVGLERIGEEDLSLASYLLSYARKSGGLVILSATTERADPQYPALQIGFHVHFSKPGNGLRKEMWRAFVPEKTPLGSDFDPALLAERFRFTGAQIKSVVRRAATIASSQEAGKLQQSHLLEQAIAEEEARHNKSSAMMYQ